MASVSTSAQAATRSDLVRQMVNVAGLVITLIINYLANALPIGGRTTAEVSDSFPVYFVPAGYVFAVWGIIYLALTAFIVYQALPAQRANPTLRRIGYLFAATCGLNSAWIFFWQYEIFPLTLAAMLGLLALLITIYIRLAVGVTRISAAGRWLVQVPFSLYLAWITVATIANVTDVLYLTGWDGLGIAAPAWATIMLVVATLIESAIVFTRRDLAYALVIIWAFVGIAAKQSTTPLVAAPALVLAGVIAFVWLGGMVFNRPRKRQLQAHPA